MKIRNGFVSNSSSSSFVMIGVEMSMEELKEKLNLPDGDYDDIDDIANKLGMYYNSEDDIFGYIIARGDYEDLESKSKSIDEISQMAKEVSVALNIPVSEVKLLTGVMAS